MPRLTPLSWRQLADVFERFGWNYAGQKGSHIKMEKPGFARPLIIPKYSEVGLDIIQGLIRTAKITREEFLAKLKPKGKVKSADDSVDVPD